MTAATARLPRTRRLLTATRFQRVFRQCKYKSGDRFISVLAVSNSLQYPRLGMAVSIRNAGNAVKRNRIKRLVRESFRQHQQQIGGCDLVVVVRPGVSARSNRQLFDSLAIHWRTIAAHAQTGFTAD